MHGRRPESDRSLIARHDSTLSAMRCLLESSQEPSPIKHCPPADTPNSRTGGNDADVSTVSDSASPETAVSESQSQSQDTDPSPSLDSVQAIPDTTEDSSQQSQESNKDDICISSSNQSLQEKNARAMDYLDHAEHVAIVLSEATNRCSLRTRAPRLWRHGCQIFDSFCAYTGVCCKLSNSRCSCY